MDRGRAGVLVMTVLGLGLGGCQSPLATVEGQVRFQGQPLHGGSIILYCADGQIVRGLIGQDGRYQVENVPLGTAQVAIHAYQPQPQGLHLLQKLPPAINGPISPGGRPQDDPQIVTLPARYAYPDESGLSVMVNRRQVHQDFDLYP